MSSVGPRYCVRCMRGTIHEPRVCDQCREARLEAFKALLQRYGATPDIYDAGEEEDPRPYLSGEKPCQRFVCVTMHAEKPFFLPRFDDAETARARAMEYATDDIFAETPVAVVDLDTGKVSVPRWDTLKWGAEA